MRMPQPAPLSRQVRDVLEELIIVGDLSPGERLVETELAVRLGVSRGPLREAIRVLEGSGWVVVHPNRGAYVRVPSETEVRDFFHVLELLESECARLAARNIDEDGIRSLERTYEEGLTAIASGERSAVMAANAAFHEAIRSHCGNHELETLMIGLSKRANWYFHSVALPLSQASWSEHEELVEALRRHDETAAAEIGRHHVSVTAAAFHENRSNASPSAATEPA